MNVDDHKPIWKKDATVGYYRKFFSSEDGKQVLGNMLLEAKFFEYTTTPEEQAVENFMKTVLTKCGGYNAKNIKTYINNLTNLPME